MKKKHFHYTLLLFSSLGIFVDTVSAQSIQAGSTTMIIQKDVASSLKYYIFSSSDVGTSPVPFPIGAKGATFDLWLTGTPPDTKTYMVDSKTVQAYSPAGTFTIGSEDPWTIGSPSSVSSYIRRTRADKGYTYTIVSSGLSSVSSAPLSSKEMRLDRRGMDYFVHEADYTTEPPTLRGPYSSVNRKGYTPENASSFPIQQLTITGNGTMSGVIEHTALTAADSTKACGEEQLILTRYADLNPDGSVLIAATIIKQVTVQVWPVTSVEVEGITNGQLITDVVPAAGVRYKDLYPDSYTYCQIYKGAPALNTIGTEVQGSVEHVGKYYYDVFNAKHGITAPPYNDPTTVPQSPEKLFVNLDAYCTSNGTWTLEVLTETPFKGRAPERLYYITFTVDRGAAIRGQITTGR